MKKLFVLFGILFSICNISFANDIIKSSSIEISQVKKNGYPFAFKLKIKANESIQKIMITDPNGNIIYEGLIKKNDFEKIFILNVDPKELNEEIDLTLVTQNSVSHYQFTPTQLK
jgi:hypothetical protein